jgi:hypothetical protein
MMPLSRFMVPKLVSRVSLIIPKDFVKARGRLHSQLPFQTTTQTNGTRKYASQQLHRDSKNRSIFLFAATITVGLGGFLLGQKYSSKESSFSKSYGDHKALKQAKEELKRMENGRLKVLDNPRTMETYGFSPNSYHPASKHSLVVKVYSTDDVVNVVNIARKYRIPVTPYSGGTSLEGHFGGVSNIRHPSYFAPERTL